MKNENPIPFWGKSKPTRRYISGHSLSYRVSNGKLFCKIMMTTKKSKSVIFDFEVKDKAFLNELQKVESYDDIRNLGVELP